MNIAGYQPLTLLDYPGRTSAIIFTQGCVFRCGYCHNPELIPTKNAAPLLDEREVLERLLARRGMVDAVCITGGEPTLQADLLAFIARLKENGFSVKLDTNGVHPAIVREAIEKKLVDFFAMDLKNVWEKYEDVIGIRNEHVVENCRESFGLIQSSGVAHEFRTTMYPGVHTSEDFLQIAGELRPRETYALQQIRFNKMLDPRIASRAPERLDAAIVAQALRAAYPELTVVVRDA